MREANSSPVDSIEALDALGRLLAVAQDASGQSAKEATFLLAWHNAEENGAWNPVDFGSLTKR